ncbi:MAG: CoB--CoM heterodisulfide reductase iron-sulfur subunit B family protein [Anaerolineae bacterium]|nr:CoB--CoM heterodisulfide reductase iron-sulfur subunit B family protein [Anaerolineae bacterium]
MNIPYFPGCTLSTKAQGFDVAGRASTKALGLELVELEQWNCCGATFPLATDNELALVGPTRVLVEAQRYGQCLATLCAICYNVLKRTAVFLQANEEKRERINLFIEEEYRGQVRVLHLLELLRDDLGFDTIQERVVKRLSGLNVAPYYGCLLLRPQAEIGLDDPDEPTILHDLLSSLGCEVVDFPYKTECCGSYLTVTAANAAQELSYTILNSAAIEGAGMVVTTCPLCQFNLDYRQKEMGRAHAGYSPVPVLYFTQLLGIALGLDSTDYGFDRHYVDPRPLLRHKGLIT